MTERLSCNKYVEIGFYGCEAVRLSCSDKRSEGGQRDMKSINITAVQALVSNNGTLLCKIYFNRKLIF